MKHLPWFIAIGLLIGAATVAKNTWDFLICMSSIAAVIGVLADRLLPERKK